MINSRFNLHAAKPFWVAKMCVKSPYLGHMGEKMKEKLYNIPVNDAVNAGSECPICYIERAIEQDMMDFVLGSGSSYMESDVREQTDKAGFCRVHFKKMYDYGNTLGNAWIMKTHMKRMNEEAARAFDMYKPGKNGLTALFKKRGGRNQLRYRMGKKQGIQLLYMQRT